MVDVCVRVKEHPADMIWIGPEIRLHIFVNLFLKIDSQSPIGSDHFVGANTCVSRNIAPRIRNAHVDGLVANNVLCAFERGVRQFVQQCLALCYGAGVTLRKKWTTKQDGRR